MTVVHTASGALTGLLAVVSTAVCGLVTKSVTFTSCRSVEQLRQMASSHSCVLYHRAVDVHGLSCESKQCSQTLAEQAYPPSCQLSNSSLNVHFQALQDNVCFFR